METKIEEMIEKINQEIEVAKVWFNMYGENNQRSMDRIDGMMSMLKILTNSAYTVDWSNARVKEK